MALLFAVPGLSWDSDRPLQHLEMFAGCCSVTRAEWQAHELGWSRLFSAIAISTAVLGDIKSEQ